MRRPRLQLCKARTKKAMFVPTKRCVEFSPLPSGTPVDGVTLKDMSDRRAFALNRWKAAGFLMLSAPLE